MNTQPQASQDGQAHLAYYDKEHDLSFVWDGKGASIEVSHGGYGEAVTCYISTTGRTAVEDRLAFFQGRCQQFVDTMYPERSERDEMNEALFRSRLIQLRDYGYQPKYNGRPTCPFCNAFVDDESTHAPTCRLVEALTK